MQETMQETNIRNYTARAQRVYQDQLAEYTLLSVEATSPEHAGESVKNWCRKMNQLDQDWETNPGQPPIQMVADSISEVMPLSTEPGTHTAWVNPGSAQCCVITVLRSGLTRYPQIDGEEQDDQQN